MLRHGPQRLDGQWPEWNEGETPGDGGPDKLDPAAAGKTAAEQKPDGIGKALEPFIPKNPIYGTLRQHYATMTANIETLRDEFIAIPELDEGQTVSAGDPYEAAELLAKRLAEEGFLDDPDEVLGDQSEVYSEKLAMKVIVGEVNRETPVFRDVMEVVEFAPYWNVPTSIASRDIVPRARRNSGYLQSRGYEIVSSYAASDTRPATSGNLSAVASGNLLIRQTPGEQNAMGRVKFLFPNEYAIYLHDTPQGDLFDESERGFSNGCIRVEDPQAVGAFILGPQGWDATKVSEHMDGDATERVEVEETVNIYLVYFTAFTAWDDDGAVMFFPDIYQLDDDRL